MLLAVVVVVVTLSALFEFPAIDALFFRSCWLVVGGVSLDDAVDDAAPVASFLLFCCC